MHVPKDEAEAFALRAEIGAFARGVASSCSVPGLFPPITINGRRYIDGGMRSATNFDLAEGYERVIAVAVIPPGGAEAVRIRSVWT